MIPFWKEIGENKGNDFTWLDKQGETGRKYVREHVNKHQAKKDIPVLVP